MMRALKDRDPEQAAAMSRARSMERPAQVQAIGRVGAKVPMVADYPSSLAEDNARGAELRVTIDGRPATPVGDSGEPLVSIVTIVFNNRAHLPRAMASVFGQSYRHIEYILVDGGSTDGTVELIEAEAHRLSVWRSGPDGGIADAFNRGVAFARGRYVGLVNSDDWMSPDQVANAVGAIEADGGAPFVFGDLIFHRADDGTPAYRVHGDPHYARKLWHGMPQFTHPTALVRREVYERHGLFDPAWKIGMDYDWLRRLHRAGVDGRHSPDIVGHMALGGVSDTRWRDSLQEHCAIAIAHGSPRWLMSPLYAFRAAKVQTRIWLEGWIPQHLLVKVRALLNRSLAPTAAASPDR